MRLADRTPLLQKLKHSFGDPVMYMGDKCKTQESPPLQLPITLLPCRLEDFLVRRSRRYEIDIAQRLGPKNGKIGGGFRLMCSQGNLDTLLCQSLGLIPIRPQCPLILGEE